MRLYYMGKQVTDLVMQHDTTVQQHKQMNTNLIIYDKY